MDQTDFDEIMRIQRMMASEVAREQETDNKIKLMSIINDMVTGPKQHVQKEAVIVEAQVQGLTDAQIDRLIGELKTDNFIVEKGGYLKKV